MMVNINSVYYDDFNPDWKVGPTSSDLYILILLVEGRCAYRLGEDLLILGKGDLLLIAPHVIRQGQVYPDQLHRKYSAFFSIPLEMKELEILQTSSYQKLQSRNLDYMKQRFSRLRHYWQRKTASSALICKGILLEMIGLTNQDHEVSQLPPMKFRFVNQIQDFILENYSSRVLVSDLAQLIDRSPNYVTRIFKEVTGQSPTEYLHYVRVAAAKDLILNTDMNLSEISDRLGFCDQAYFNRVFKKVTGIPPSLFSNGRRGGK